MNFAKYSFVLVYLLHILGCAAPHANKEKLNRSVGVLLSQHVIDDSDFRISLYESVIGDHLQYVIENTKSSKFISLKSSRYKSDGFDLNLGKGQGIVIHLRPDGKAFLINEWQDCAVQEGNMIYIVMGENGKPTRSSYRARNAELFESSEVGVELIEKFRGWNPEGEPIIDAVSQ